jgi:hypothetical protein
MAENWTSITTEVASALADVGFSATLYRPGGKTGPENDPTFLPATSHPITVMLDTISLGMIDGSVIHAGDKRVMMAAGGIVPTTADRVSLSSADATGLSVVRVEPFAPAGVDLYYELLLRS